MRATTRLLLFASLLFIPAVLPAESLLGLPWSSHQQLARIAAAGLRVRYLSSQIVFLDGDARSRQIADDLGLSPVLADTCGPDQAYFLAESLHLPLDPSVVLVYRHPSGWALLRLPRARLSAALDQQSFLWPLPEDYRLDGWLEARPRARPAAALSSATVAELLSRVDTTRLQEYVKTLSLIDPAGGSAPGNRRTRYARRPEILEATAYLRGQLAASLGDGAVQLEEFQVSPEEPAMYNVVGVLEGTDPQAGYYVISAHYDAIGARSPDWNWRTDPAPGADDNASGAALVLECARLLAGQRLPWSVHFALFCGEELGLWGSRHTASQAAARDDAILGVLNFDMVGFNDLRQRLELVTNPASHWLVDQMIDAEQRYAIGLKLDVLEDTYATLSDHSSFWARGYDAILGIENYLPTDSTTYGVRRGDYRINTQYHTVLDLPDSLNWELVGRVTRLAVATLAQYSEESGLPDLAVFTGDLSSDAQDRLRVRVRNAGLGRLEGSYQVRVSRCGADSADCQVVYDQEQPGPLPPGGAAEITIPWGRFGEMVFLVEVDPRDRIAESDEQDNRAYQNVRLVPHSDIVVFPNPFAPARDEFLRFSGVPLNAEVRIFAVSGELVWAAHEDDSRQRKIGAKPNEVLWLGVNGSGGNDEQAPLVGAGIYLYTIRSQSGEVLRQDKIAVIR